jgi:uncharacterized membrane protein
LVAYNKEIRAKARAQLKGKWGTPILVCFLSMIISGVISFIPGIGGIAALILSGPITLGLTIFFIKVASGEQAEVGNLFDGFNNFVPAMVLYLWMMLWVFLWTLLLIIPGIIKSLSYSMSFYVLADDPQISFREALNVSKRMTMGYKGRIFLLGLSFIGWAILACLTLGIGFLWLTPYMQTSFANLFIELKNEAVANGRYNSSLAGNTVSA